MPHEDLKAEVITFSAATLDGVAAFICPFIDNLVQNPNVLARLLPEIDSADTAGKLSKPVVTYDETTRLKYFMACISETLRRDAPAQTILPRIVSKGGYEIYGRYIPEGTRMGASPYIIHRDSNIFGPEPDEFKPERWLEGDGVEQFVAQMEKYGMWWGYGDRECAGKYYAQMEMQKLCLELVRRFKFESPVDGGERFVHKRWAVGMFWNYRLVFRDRKRGVL